MVKIERGIGRHRGKKKFAHSGFAKSGLGPRLCKTGSLWRVALALMGLVISYKPRGDLTARDLRNQEANRSSVMRGEPIRREKHPAGLAGGVSRKGCRLGRFARLRLADRPDPAFVP
jgi:hypothetical protein